MKIPAKHILIIDSIHPSFIAALEKEGFIITDGTTFSREEVLKNIGNYNGLVIRSRFKLDQDFLSQTGTLKFIARAGAGMENIDLDYAASKNITCLHAPEGNRDAVGEHAIGMLLSLFNHLNRADAEVRRGIWKREENRGIELSGKTIGVIGYGNMGTAFVKKLAGFDVKVLIYDKYKTIEKGPYFQSIVMQQLYDECDVLSLHIPLTKETNYLIDDKELSRYKKNIYLINTSRGKIVQTADLVKHLQSGKVSGAVLDVLEYESVSFENLDSSVLPEPFQYLIKSEKVILSPHIAGWTKESNHKIAHILAGKIMDKFTSM